jgi:flavin reductase (DIM6/NTAB) family NADH-FMN oxidoreductase RutF
VSILDDSAEDAARWFATSGRPLDGQMERFPHRRAESGVALLECSLAQLECDTVNLVPAGDHDIVVGAVTAVALAPGGRPLLHWDGGYRDLAADGRASRSTPA